MAHVNGNHFVRVKLKPNCPSPDINTVYTLPNNKNDQWNNKLGQGLWSLLQFNKQGEVRASNAGPNLGDGGPGLGPDLGDTGLGHTGLDNHFTEGPDLGDTDLGHTGLSPHFTEGKGVKNLTDDNQLEQPHSPPRQGVDNQLEQSHSPPRQGVDIKLEQQPQESQPRQRRRNTHGQIPQKRSLPKRSRSKPVIYVDIDCLKQQAKKRNAKKKKVEDKNVEEKKNVDPKVSESSSRILPPLTEGEGSFRPRDGTSVKSSDSEDEGDRLVMPRDDTVYVNSSGSENEEGRSSKQRDGTTSRLKFTEGDSGFKKEDRENRKAVERSEDSKSVSTTLSERKKIDDTIRPMIQQLSEYFELEDEEEGHSLKTFEELIEKKGKKWRVPKARMVVELLKTF